MNKKEAKILSRFKVIVFLSILIIFYYLIIVIPKQTNQRISENMHITTGLITSIESIVKGGISYKYSYNFNGKVYNKSKSGDVNNDIFIHKNFPVIINRKNPDEVRILIYERDFERFSIPFPDSLNWVKKYSIKGRYTET